MRELFTIVLQFRESTVGSPIFLLRRVGPDGLGYRTTSIIIACQNRLVEMLNVTRTG